MALAGCFYSFTGGGLPQGIRTVAVLPFDNLTAEPALLTSVDSAVREAVQSRLGLRQASEAQADALVRGTIVRYEPELPVAFTGNDQNNRVDVTRRLVELTVNVEILDRRAEKALWQRSGLVVRGEYDPGQEREGRARALDQLVVNIVEGAQSQW